MLKIVIATAMTGLVLYDVTVPVPTVVSVEPNATHRSLKGDRLPIGPGCSGPHQNASCKRKRMPDTDPPQILTDVRIASFNLLANPAIAMNDDAMSLISMSRINMSRINIGVSIFVIAAGVVITSHSAFAQPLGYAPASGQRLSIFGRALSNAGGTNATDERGAVPQYLRRHVVAYSTREAPGAIIVDTPNTVLYYVLGGGKAISYGIGVGREGFTWSGVQTIARKAEWPDWIPPAEMIHRQPYLPRFMAGGPGNPLGARALYLGGTAYRIHGTNAPETIGKRVSSGCIRMLNEDVIDLYGRVNLGTRVVVRPQRPHVATNLVEHRAPIVRATATLGQGGVPAFGLY